MKTSIEVQALKDRAKIEMEQIDAQTERQVDAAKKAAMAQGIFYQPYLDQIGDKIRELGQHEKESLQSATTSEVDVAQAKGAISTRKIVVDEYKSIFQSLKQQAGGVFDALVTKSQSVWRPLNSLRPHARDQRRRDFARRGDVDGAVRARRECSVAARRYGHRRRPR
jgi:hypothetical protein